MTGPVAWVSPAARRVQCWQLWSIPLHGRIAILGTEAIAIAVIAPRDSWAPATLRSLLILLLLSSAFAALGNQLDRLVRLLAALGPGPNRTAGVISSDQLAVWETAGMLILPARVAGLLVVAVYLRPIGRAYRDQTGKPHRTVFSCAASVLAVNAGSATLTALRAPALSAPQTALAAVVGGVIFTVTSLTVITALRWLIARPPKLSSLLPRAPAWRDEGSGVALGLVSGALVAAVPWMSPLVLILVLALRRSTLARQLQSTMSTDAKTGVLTLPAWQHDVARLIAGTAQRRGAWVVLMIDMDHFKSINDSYGHLVGDEVLHAAAQRLKGQLRQQDLLARFGGEEFVAYLNDTTIDRAREISDRLLGSLGPIRTSMGAEGESITVTASIGIAAYPVHGTDLTALLAAADRALFAAKAAGRNQHALAATLV
jgi:diguanylate cyclase (GGDEF)-like protein